MKSKKYGIISLRKQFPNEDAILDFIFKARHTEECSCGGTYSRLKGRKQYQCSQCRYQIAPTAGTIFHKSDTPLSLWFHAIMVFSNAKSGMSALALQRDLEVTYKTAWRMLRLIRKALKQNNNKLSGDVEIDGSYFGGHFPSGPYNINRSAAVKAKSAVMGAVQRGGNMRVQIVKDMSAEAHGKFLEKHVEKVGTRLMTDKTNRLDKVAVGFNRHAVDHHRKELVRGDVHVNTIETFWSHVKRSIGGTHKVVSKKYLQAYLDGFVWHYNNRHSDNERFSSLLDVLLQPAK